MTYFYSLTVVIHWIFINDQIIIYSLWRFKRLINLNYIIVIILLINIYIIVVCKIYWNKLLLLLLLLLSLKI